MLRGRFLISTTVTPFGVTNLVDATGTMTFTDYAGGLLNTEYGVWSNAITI
jgi:hypothetical protein